MQPETIISEKTLHEGEVLSFSLRQVRLPDGTLVQREIASNRGAVVIVALTDDRQVRLVKQFRSAAQDWIIELPAGGLEPDENPDLAAARELLEETGDQATEWQKLGGFYSAPGILTEYVHLYLASGLKPGPPHLEFDEFIETLTVPLNEAIAMSRRQEIQDAKTITGLLLTSLYLEEIK